MDSMVVSLNAFDFSFLPEMTVTNPEIVITFDKKVQSEVQVFGQVELKGEDETPHYFSVDMIKSFEDKDYIIKMSSNETMPLKLMEKNVVPSMEPIKLLPDDENLVKMLKVFNIDETVFGVGSPKIVMSLSPYPNIKLTGTHILLPDVE